MPSTNTAYQTLEPSRRFNPLHSENGRAITWCSITSTVALTALVASFALLNVGCLFAPGNCDFADSVSSSSSSGSCSSDTYMYHYNRTACQIFGNILLAMFGLGGAFLFVNLSTQACRYHGPDNLGSLCWNIVRLPSDMLSGVSSGLNAIYTSMRDTCKETCFEKIEKKEDRLV